MPFGKSRMRVAVDSIVATIDGVSAAAGGHEVG